MTLLCCLIANRGAILFELDRMVRKSETMTKSTTTTTTTTKHEKNKKGSFSKKNSSMKKCGVWLCETVLLVFFVFDFAINFN